MAGTSKTTRASGPAAETQAGRVHLVGTFPELEYQFTTYEPGDSKSPNRYDAAVYAILELCGLTAENDTRRNVESAAAAHKRLRAGVARVNKGRRIGL